MSSKPELSKAQTLSTAVVDHSGSDSLAGLKAGELLLHVFIEETRGLKNSKALDSTVDPIVEIKAFGKTRYSKVIKEVGSGATYWGEHFFFEKQFQTTYELENEKVLISVSDHKFLGFKSVLGTVELNIPTIYYKDKHCLQYQWAALSGLTENFQDVHGFIKFSVGVFAPGDEQLPLTEEKQIQGGKSAIPNILYPPQIITQTYQLSVKVLNAENLKKMDVLGKTDAYVQVLYGGLEAKTEIKKLTYEPVWNEELRIPVSLPTVNENITIRLFDWNSGLQTDELMGTVTFNIKDIMNKKYKNPFWTNFYGSYDGSKDAYGKIQNEVCELGPEWHGRLMLALTMREEPKATLGSNPFREAVFTKTGKEAFDMKAEIHYAMNLRKDGEDYTVKVKWGNFELSTKKKSSKNRLAEFFESLTLPTLFPFESNPNEEIPDVFVYLNNGEKDISYIRKPWTFFANLSAKPYNFYFKVNKAKTTTRDDLAGIVKLRLLITKATEKPNLSLYGWDKPIKKKEAKTEWRIHCNIYQAKDLIAGDSSGASDPYLSLYFFGQEAKTTVIPQTLNPVWNEKIEFVTTFDSVDDAPPILLTLWDQDAGNADDFIGTSKIVLEKRNLNPETFPKPEWVEVKYGKDTITVGKILLSICCYSRRELIPRSPYIEPETSRYFVNLKILGLRQLESTGILPVKRAFVRFDVDSLKRRDDKSFLPEKKFVRTEPLNPGPNPNILTVINLELNLPRDPAFCPAMTAAVYDYIFKGMMQPLIGTFSIPLGDMITQTSKEMEKRIDKLTKIYYQTQAAEEKKQKEALEKKAIAAPIEHFNIEMGSKSFEESRLSESKKEYTQATDLESSQNESKPLLGRYQEALTDRFEEVKKNKGYLPGENEAIQVQLYDNKNQSVVEEDPDLQITEEAVKSLKYVQIAKYDPRGDEIEQPDVSQFLELGHHNKEGTFKKHYRYALDTELEKSGMTDESPFLQIPIYRGKRIAEENFLSSILGSKEADYRCVGYFKSMVTVMSELDKLRFDSKLKHVGQFAKTKGLEFSDDEFLRRREVVVRLYVLDAEGLPDKDDDSNSDPYLVVKFGKYTQNMRKEYQLDTPNPKFHKCFEFPATLPGASRVTLQLWDWDRLDADDLIGSTDIDIEDRWYSTKWRSLKHIPVETRNLYHPSSKLAQGKVRLWLEIWPKDTPSPPIWNITPKPSQDFELRVVVWECKDVPNVDLEDASDIYITGKLDDGQHYRTDTHFRSQNGKASFNWRMVFPVQLPMRKHRITFSIWDKDILSANDFISEATFDFTTQAQRAFVKEETTKIHGPNGSDLKFWIPCTNSKIVDGRAVQENLGSVLVSMTLVPKAAGELVPVGQGRADPNQHPYLPPPEGRFEWTWSLPKLYNQLIGPIARRKICLWMVGFVLILIVIMSIPSIIGSEIAKNII